MSIEAQFQQAIDQVKNSSASKPPSQDLKLEMYGLYKQALEGDVKGSAPSMLNPVGRAKHKAWAKQKGMSKEEAMQAYIEKVEAALSAKAF